MTAHLESPEALAANLCPFPPTGADEARGLMRCGAEIAVRARDEQYKSLLAPLVAAHEAMEKRPGPSELDDFVLAARRVCAALRGGGR